MPENIQASAPQNKPIRHLNQIELSRRWTISPRTLERWRWLGQGPNYLKVGGRVVYRLDDIDAYEAKHLHTGTSNVGRQLWTTGATDERR
jgi:hypothetical protein